MVGTLAGEEMNGSPRIKARLEKKSEPELGSLAELRHVCQAIGNTDIQFSHSSKNYYLSTYYVLVTIWAL